VACSRLAARKAGGTWQQARPRFSSRKSLKGAALNSSGGRAAAAALNSRRGGRAAAAGLTQHQVLPYNCSRFEQDAWHGRRGALLLLLLVLVLVLLVQLVLVLLVLLVAPCPSVCLYRCGGGLPPASSSPCICRPCRRHGRSSPAGAIAAAPAARSPGCCGSGCLGPCRCCCQQRRVCVWHQAHQHVPQQQGGRQAGLRDRHGWYHPGRYWHSAEERLARYQ
jgi:hypothetical protein